MLRRQSSESGYIRSETSPFGQYVLPDGVFFVRKSCALEPSGGWWRADGGYVAWPIGCFYSSDSASTSDVAFRSGYNGIEKSCDGIADAECFLLLE